MTSSFALRRSRFRFPGASQVAERLSALAAYIEDYLRYRRECRALLRLDEHMLKDIGLSRSDAERIAGQPYRPRIRW